MILTFTDQEFQELRVVAIDDDKDEALQLVKSSIKMLEQKKHQKIKSHLDG